jgi:hypothetical protein
MGVKHGSPDGNNHIEYILIPKMNKVIYLEHFSTNYLINLYNYELLFEGYCRIDMERQGIDACLWETSYKASVCKTGLTRVYIVKT